MNKKRVPVAGISTRWQAHQKAKRDPLRNSRITLSGSTNKAPENLTGNGTVADNLLIDRLAQQVLQWRVGPGRFLAGNRSWLPKWRFNPLKRIEDVFTLLDSCKSIRYVISKTHGRFQVEVEYNGKIGKAVGNSKPRTISLALARSLELEV